MNDDVYVDQSSYRICSNIGTETCAISYLVSNLRPFSGHELAIFEIVTYRHPN